MNNNNQLMTRLAGLALALALGLAMPADAQFDTSDEYVMIGYAEAAEHNPVARLQEQLINGETTLTYSEERGYLDSILATLDIDPDSQMLVFSPTSLQHKLINPDTPRGLYFNDNTYIGFVQNSNIVEVTTVDDNFGLVFYTFDNTPGTDRYFERADQTCLVCHDTQGTMGGGVPMLMALSSVYNTRNIPLQNFSGVGNVSDATPIEDRWGGWYVTGRHGLQAHLGNVLLDDESELDNLDDHRIWNVENLEEAGYLDTSPYIRDTSDIVALLVLEHQVTVQNQITYIKFKAPAVLERRGMEEAKDADSWMALPEAARKSLGRMLDKLVKQMVFIDAADLASRISGSQAFVDGFQARGPKDAQGRSLRELELKGKMFKYPLSYLVYAEDFITLPAYAKDYVYQRLAAYLGGEDLYEGHSQFTKAERRAALDILAATDPAFTPYVQRAIPAHAQVSGTTGWH